MQTKRPVLRKCVGCSQMLPKKELVRVVKSPEGDISLDRTGRKPGRGAYICGKLCCLQAARKARRLEKAFACPIPAGVYESMEEELRRNEQGNQRSAGDVPSGWEADHRL